MNELNDIILNAYSSKKLKIETHKVSYIEPLIELSEEQLGSLLEGDGQSKDRYKQINSSTGLAIAYYKLLEEQGKIKNLIFENKVAKPLKRGGRYANVDVSFTRDEKLFFVESKFLEPFYGANENIREAYKDPNKYPIEVKEEDHEKWKKLFEKTDGFCYYNFTQLCRHLLAIYRYTHGYADADYSGEDVVLQSVMWKMTDDFLNLISDVKREDLLERIDKLENEKKCCEHFINSFIEDIGWSNMKFEALYYNDILNDIKNSSKFEDFCKRYFFNLQE